MTDTSGTRRKLRLFNLNTVRHLASNDNHVTTTLEDIGDVGTGGNAQVGATNVKRPLRRSHTLNLGASLVCKSATHGTHNNYNEAETPSIMRLLPRLRPARQEAVGASFPTSPRRKDSYGDNQIELNDLVVDDDYSSVSSPLATPIPAAYARFLKRASATAPPIGNINNAKSMVDPYRLRTLPRPEDRRARVSRIYSDLSRKRLSASRGDPTGVSLQTIQGVPLMTPVSATAAARGGLSNAKYQAQTFMQQRRQIGYDPRPQDVVEKCERWVASLPATFARTHNDVISVLSSETPTDFSSDSGSDIERISQIGVS